jgi:ribonucleoside-diphosphate reductase alpha subunit
MFVLKRDGSREEVKFDKVTERVKKLCFGLNMKYVNPTLVARHVSTGMVDDITTSKLDVLASHVAADLSTKHPDYNILSGRIMVSNLQKEIKVPFSEAMDQLYKYTNPATKKHAPVISKELWEVIMKNADRLNNIIVDERDFEYDIFGIETLRRSYLLRAGNKILETPQYMHLRVALGIHGEDIDSAEEMYEMLSKRLYTHSTPTLFNSGTPRPQMASCFLLAMEDDSIEGIFNTVKDCALISKYAGGIGVNIHNIRSSGSYIEGTNGTSNGIVPFLKVFNETARAVNQAGRRRGSFAMYLEPHHADIFQFIDLRRPGGVEEFRTRDLFLALWVSDLFMERVSNGDTWTLFDPNSAPGLEDVWGNEYRQLYEQYEREGRGIKTIKAQDLWTELCKAQIETGTPYILNKDQCNLKSNQQNLGTIKSSNLCAEIIEYTSPDEIACCNLSQINLSKYVNMVDNTVDYEGLVEIAKHAVRNLNLVIDRTFYPVEKAKISNFKHRPLALGVSGLHDVFFKLRLASFDCPEARLINKRIFESIYRGAVLASVELAKEHGPYESFSGSPASRGLLQFDLWGLKSKDLYWKDWDNIKQEIIQHGMRNSLLVALMPTASSATIMGVTECFEIQTSNLYSRKVLSGEFTLINKYLINELIEHGLWNEDIMMNILGNDGSIQHIDVIPKEIRERYKTVWEYSMRSVIDMASDRSPFVDQSQSLNLFLKNPTVPKLTSMHLYSWKKGLKTMSYYLRSRAATEAIKFTVNNQNPTSTEEEEEICLACSA